MKPTALKFLDFALLQAGWFACVVGAAYERYWLGPAVVAGALAVHCAFAPRPARDLRLAGALLLIGGLVDALQVSLGVVDYGVGAPRLLLVPIWILALWPLFASTFHTTLAWLQARPMLAALLGFLGGPPGYLAADRFGALQLAEPLWASLFVLGVAWAAVLPLGLWLARRQDRPATARREAHA